MVERQSQQTLIVVGGGAAGFFGAITAAQTRGLRTILLEAGPNVLSKVRISGGGRCNVTHACFDPAELVKHYPRGSRELRGAFSRFQPGDTVAWFEQRGVDLNIEGDGRMFPTTNDSGTIVDCLQQAARRAGVEVRTRSAVIQIDRHNEKPHPFTIKLKTGERLFANYVLLATGSSPIGHRLAKHLEHRIVAPVPSLFTLAIADSRLEGLAGVSVQDAQVSLSWAKATAAKAKDGEEATAQGSKQTKQKLVQRGPVLVAHWGLSGPAVLKLSAWGARALHEHRYRGDLTVNWLPHWNGEQVRQELQELKAILAKRAIATRPQFGLPRRLWRSLIAASKILPEQRWGDLSKKQLNRLVDELVRGHSRVKGKGVFKDEFVTCGGVDLKQVNFKTMESRCCPGLYLAGEVLDIDGITGGFNFQSAWTTSWLAGEAIASLSQSVSSQPSSR